MLNEQIFYYLNSLTGKNSIFDGFIVFSARYLIIILFVFCALFLFKISKKTFISLFFALVIATLLTQLFKFFMPINRPFVNREVNLLFEPPYDSSFPSNHAVLAGICAFSLFFYKKKAGILAILAAVLIGLARIFAGVHWPIDVLAGLLLSFLVSLITKRVLIR